MIERWWGDKIGDLNLNRKSIEKLWIYEKKELLDINLLENGISANLLKNMKNMG